MFFWCCSLSLSLRCWFNYTTPPRSQFSFSSPIAAPIVSPTFVVSYFCEMFFLCFESFDPLPPPHTLHKNKLLLFLIIPTLFSFFFLPAQRRKESPNWSSPTTHRRVQSICRGDRQLLRRYSVNFSAIESHIIPEIRSRKMLMKSGYVRIRLRWVLWFDPDAFSLCIYWATTTRHKTILANVCYISSQLEGLWKKKKNENETENGIKVFIAEVVKERERAVLLSNKSQFQFSSIRLLVQWWNIKKPRKRPEKEVD